MIIDFIIEDLMLNSYLQKNFHTLDCKCHKYNAGWLYRVLSTTDAAKLEEHEKRVSEAAKAFWQAEHARRTQATA